MLFGIPLVEGPKDQNVGALCFYAFLHPTGVLHIFEGRGCRKGLERV